jgi:TadE-like protein
VRRRSRGQSLLEFAVLSPVLLLLVMGMLDLGRAYYFEVLGTDAARDAARYATGYAPNVWPPVGPGQTGICDLAKADLANDVSSVSCVYTTTLPAAGRPYYPAGTYVPASGQALVVIACPAGTDACMGSAQTLNTNVAVTVYYRFDLLTPGMSTLFGPSLTFQNSAVMKSLW